VVPVAWPEAVEVVVVEVAGVLIDDNTPRQIH
jgi:hypothetical protein